jgi:predicted aspartyl protease
MNFIFDTGASDVSISLTEAMFMIKNGYLNESDIFGTEYYKIANGEIQEGTKIVIRELEFDGLILFNIEASVVHNLDAPLLLGQSAISLLGKIQIDYNKNTLTVIK